MEEPRSGRWGNRVKRGEATECETTPPVNEFGSRSEVCEDLFDAVCGVDTPATAKDVADITGRSVHVVRDYLNWFERIEIVRQVTESPVAYDRDYTYLNWCDVELLRETYPVEALLAFLEANGGCGEPLSTSSIGESPRRSDYLKSCRNHR